MGSFTATFVDLGIIWAYFIDGNWVDQIPVDKKTHPNISVYAKIIPFIPVWWRFWQCVQKWYTKDNRVHLANAIKYCTKFGVCAVLAWGSSKFFEPGKDQETFWPFFCC